MGYYTITSHSGNGLRLNVAASAALNARTNVNISSAAKNNNQIWVISSLGSNVEVKSASNIRYMLNAATASNCDVYTSNADTYINFIKVSTGIYRLQLQSNTKKYLTVDAQTNGTTAKWAELDTNNAGQKWKVATTTCDYIMGTSWLKMYTSPTGTDGRTVSMPTVDSFKGTDGYTYKFTDKNYWYSYENPYGTKRINPYAITQIKAVTGSDPVINVGAEGDYTDPNGNYWMAVGPNVVNPDHKSNASITPSEMYAKGKLDVVVKDSAGTLFYIPGVVGDAKAHTWSNGIIQTFRSYPNGVLESAKGNFNGLVCAEFIGSLSGKLKGLGDFSIEEIIFYET